MSAMTQASVLTRGRWLPSPAAARAILLLLVAASVAASPLMDDAAASGQAVDAAGADLTRLLRMMALLKAGIAAGLLAAIFWRLADAVTPGRLAAYALSCGAMAAGPVLIWDMTHIVAGAILLHGGLLTGLALLWRDPAVGARLAAILAARRGRSLSGLTR